MSQPDVDNLMPKGGQFFATEDPEVKTERETEKANVFNALPLIKEILDHLDKRIAFYASVDSIPADTQSNPEVFMHTVAGNKLAMADLKAEKNYLEGLLEQHVK